MSRLAHPALAPSSSSPPATADSFWDEDRAYDEFASSFEEPDYIDMASEIRDAMGIRQAPSNSRRWA